MKRTNIKLIEGGITELKDVYQRFTDDFAIDERKEYKHLVGLLTEKKYKLLLAKDLIINEIVGYAFIYEFDHLQAIWLDYFAINKKYRNLGFGTDLFYKLIQYKQDGIGVFLEVEIPEECEGLTREGQIRRINFYERLGAKRLQISYELPTNNGGFPMYLYFKPSTNVQVLSKIQIQEAITGVFDTIHADVNNKHDILKGILATVNDEYFFMIVT